MPTLHVREVPDKLYEALREKAKAEKRSISAETISILRKDLERPFVSAEDLLRSIKEGRKRYRPGKGAPTADALIRLDRGR